MRSFRATAILAALCAGVSAFATAQPAHYAVFHLDDEGRAVPVYYERVELADDRSNPRTDGAAAHAARGALSWRNLDGTRPGKVHSVDLESIMHAEFARDPASSSGEIESFDVPNPQRSFVVRLPVSEGHTIALTGPGDRTQVIDLASIAASATALPLMKTVARMQLPRVATDGNPANRVDILVFGDGYTAAQQGTFNGAVATLKSQFFNVTPYMEYESFVNWTPVFLTSQDSGATHPPYQAGCTTDACCSDVEAQGDPRNGQITRTALGSRFCVNQIHRLLVVDYDLTFATAAAYPNWDVIVVSVNDPVYGGSGGSVGTISANSVAWQILTHEYGHTFTKLADEYSSAYPGFPACSDISGSAHCEANVTDQTSTSSSKWRSWFTPGNPIPTPPGTPGVGLFQGARYLSSGMYRPVNQCMMRVLNVDFCPICAQEYVKQLYRGGWGVPAGGIDLIEPGSETPSTQQPVAYAPGDDLSFSASLLAPTIGALGVQWTLDGQPIPGAHSAQYMFHQDAATPATRTLALHVDDQTPLVNGAMADGLLDSTRTWTIEVGGDRIFRNGFDT